MEPSCCRQSREAGWSRCWQHALKGCWSALRFGEMKIDTRNAEHAFEVQVRFNELNPGAVRVEFYADGSLGRPAERQAMDCLNPVDGASGSYLYHVVVSAARDAADYAARIIPYLDGVAVPLEEPEILWQR